MHELHFEESVWPEVSEARPAAQLSQAEAPLAGW